MMAVFLDIYGNEARVLIDAKTFAKPNAQASAKKPGKVVKKTEKKKAVKK